jgi:hypothetical protein
MDELIRLRARLGALIREHRKTEEEAIFVPLFLHGCIDRLPQLKADLEQIKVAKGHYSAHVQRWTPLTIESDWSGYAAAVAGRVEALEAMIRFEEERVYRPVFALQASDKSRARAQAVTGH